MAMHTGKESGFAGTGKSAKGLAKALGTAALMATGPALAGEPACFLKDGDRLGFCGDSITDVSVYTRVVERVFRHYHPDSSVSFVNNGRSGRQTAGTTPADALKGDPSVITVMLGMNDAINGPWVQGMPVEPVVEKYRADLTRIVRELKAAGKAVVLLTPTLTDETVAVTPFRLEGTEAVLRRMGKVCHEIAAAEQLACIPMQEEFEAWQNSRPLREQRLRHDGVHPTSIGQYTMARILWQHLGLANPLATGARALAAPADPLPVSLELSQRLLSTDTARIDLVFSTPAPLDATLAWSTAAARGTAALKLSGRDTWTLELPPAALPQANGDVSDLIVSLESQGRRVLFVVDFARNRVFHLQNGAMSAGIDSDKERPEGKRVCDYRFQKDGKRLLFEATVRDSQVLSAHAAGCWPWNADAVTLYLDLRPGPRFGGLAMESDVYQVWFQPQLDPVYTPGFRPWLGKHFESLAVPFGAKTDTGYSVGLVIDGWRNLHEQFDIEKLDYLGFDLAVFEADRGDKGPAVKQVYGLQKTMRPTYLYASSFTILDLKNQFPGDAAIVANVFP